MEASVEQFKERARTTWAAGDFDEISKMILDVGRKLVGRVDIEPGMRVLDVACGTGNATIPAALAGGVCTGLDLTPELFESGTHPCGRGRSRDQLGRGRRRGSAFPRQQLRPRDLDLRRHVRAAPRARRGRARPCLCTRRDHRARLLAALRPDRRHVQARRFADADAAVLCEAAHPLGEESHVRSLLEPRGLELTFEPEVAIFRGDSAELVVQRKEAYFGPWRMAQASLGDEWSDLRAQLVDLYEEHFHSEDAAQVGAFGDYLITLARKPR